MLAVPLAGPARANDPDGPTPPSRFERLKGGLEQGVGEWNSIFKGAHQDPAFPELRESYYELVRGVASAKTEEELREAAARFLALKERAMDLLVPQAAERFKRMSPEERARYVREEGEKLPGEFLHALDSALSVDGLSLAPDGDARRSLARLDSLQREIDRFGRFGMDNQFDGRPLTGAPSPEDVPSAPPGRPYTPYGQPAPVPAEIPLPAVGLKDLPALEAGDARFAAYMARIAGCRPEIVETLFQAAREYNYNMQQTLGALGMIRAESSCNPNNYTGNSKGGARGLTQVIPDTGKEIVAELRRQRPDLNVPEYNNQVIYDPKYNLLLGLWYFKKNLNRFGDSVEYAAAAHNAGPGNALSYRSIGETSVYVPRVLAYYRDHLNAALHYNRTASAAR